MATRCPICAKKPMTATKRVLLRGHYNPTMKYRKYPNLQWARVDGKRIQICTSCIKTQAKAPRVRTATPAPPKTVKTA